MRILIAGRFGRVRKRKKVASGKWRVASEGTKKEEKKKKRKRKKRRKDNAETLRAQRSAEEDKKAEGETRGRARGLSSTPASIQTRRRTSGTCGTRCWAYRWCAFCGMWGYACRLKIIFAVMGS